MGRWIFSINVTLYNRVDHPEGIADDQTDAKSRSDSDAEWLCMGGQSRASVHQRLAGPASIQRCPINPDSKVFRTAGRPTSPSDRHADPTSPARAARAGVRA